MGKKREGAFGGFWGPGWWLQECLLCNYLSNWTFLFYVLLFVCVFHNKERMKKYMNE